VCFLFNHDQGVLLASFPSDWTSCDPLQEQLAIQAAAASQRNSKLMADIQMQLDVKLDVDEAAKVGEDTNGCC
jgi:hypothetical protein